MTVTPPWHSARVMRNPSRKQVADVVACEERCSRIFGLIAILSLPPRVGGDGKYRRIEVQIEVSPTLWLAIDRISFDGEVVEFMFGTNGHTKTYRFLARECPRWRARP